jgi:RimJ/RimL family protein N-acetyltransferase
MPLETSAAPLSNKLVLLRAYRPGDCDPLYTAVHESFAELNRWLPWCHSGYTREDSAAWIEARPSAWVSGEEYCFVIADPHSGEMLGGCGLNQFDPARLRCNLGYWVRSSQTGRGIATAATRLLARFGLEALELERIEIVAAVGNTASQRVAEKAGAVREGVARRRLRVHGIQHDAVVYSFVRDDLPRLVSLTGPA